MFYKMILHAHSFWAYLVLAVVAVASVNAILGFFGKKEYKQKDLRIGLFGLIVTHIQILLGIVLYFISPLFGSWSEGGAKVVMKNGTLRKMLVEHPTMTVIAVILITIGWSLHKKQKTSQRAFGKIALFYSLGLVCLLAAIPWERWL